VEGSDFLDFFGCFFGQYKKVTKDLRFGTVRTTGWSASQTARAIRPSLWLVSVVPFLLLLFFGQAKKSKRK